MKTNELSSHPLLAPRVAKTGYVRYVYSAADAEEILSAIFDTADDTAAAAEAIIAVIGQSDFSAALTARRASAAPARATTPAPGTVARATLAYSTCRCCGGPLSIQTSRPTRCDEC